MRRLIPIFCACLYLGLTAPVFAQAQLPDLWLRDAEGKSVPLTVTAQNEPERCTLLIFWFRDCPPCNRMLNDLKLDEQAYRDAGFDIRTVYVLQPGLGGAPTERIGEALPSPFPTSYDTGEVKRALFITAVPCVLFIRDGKELCRRIGYGTPDASAGLSAVLEALANGQDPPGGYTDYEELQAFTEQRQAEQAAAEAERKEQAEQERHEIIHARDETIDVFIRFGKHHNPAWADEVIRKWGGWGLIESGYVPSGTGPQPYYIWRGPWCTHERRMLVTLKLTMTGTSSWYVNVWVQPLEGEC